ncbi:hypothetical protein [Fusobacterium ulcerans]|uniref:hypothetical protein n=1 Tax=Fusobacterium ulcerans TaxID=861 RepID=UPI001031299C|nr:hypothetical protein [Fusobacterium ulcerans]
MEIVNITTANYTTNIISILIKYNSGKTGSVDIGNGEVRNSTLPEGVKNKIISLIAKDSYKWLKAKYKRVTEEEKQEDDPDCCLRDYTREKELLKRIHNELKILYT